MKVYSHLNVKKSLVPFQVGLGEYKDAVKKSLLKEHPDATGVKVTSVGKKADDMCGEDYWHLTAEGEV